MPVVTDSYMGIFLPPDLPGRIKQFMASQIDFPFIRMDELLAVFYLLGKDHGVTEPETAAAADLAKRAVDQLARDIRLYTAMPQKMDSKFTRENYSKRSIQIVIDSGSNNSELASRVAGDPTILSDSFAQHVAYHKQNYFFELFQPFKEDELPAALRQKLQDRMLLLGFNVQDRQSLPFKSSLEPFFDWMSGRGTGMKLKV